MTHLVPEDPSALLWHNFDVEFFCAALSFFRLVPCYKCSSWWKAELVGVGYFKGRGVEQSGEKEMVGGLGGEWFLFIIHLEILFCKL